MKLKEAQSLLDDMGIAYALVSDKKLLPEYLQEYAVGQALWIDNPNHQLGVAMMFAERQGTLVLEELYFGPYDYEWFGMSDGWLRENFLSTISAIVTGKHFVVRKNDMHTGNWLGDACFDEEDMDAFEKTVERIRRPRRFRKVFGRCAVYEIYNWQTYERIVR